LINSKFGLSPQKNEKRAIKIAYRMPVQIPEKVQKILAEIRAEKIGRSKFPLS
jgi:hypothetical protein